MNLQLSQFLFVVNIIKTGKCYPKKVLILFPNADDEPPTVICPNTTTVDVDAGMATANVTWSPSPTANDTVDGVINSTTIVCEDSLGNVVMSDTLYSVGLTTVTCRANDTALNEGSCDFNITVVGMYFLNLKHFCCSCFVRF